MKICKLCGKEFEPKVYNATICYDRHDIPCRICGNPVNIDGPTNKAKRKMYLERGYVYCSHNCSCIGAGQDKWDNANAKVDMDRLKYLRTQTSMFDIDIAKELNTTVDFVISRCERYGWNRPEELKKELQENKNNIVSDIMTEKYKDEEVKNEMLQKASDTYKERTGFEHNFKNPEEVAKYVEIKREKYGDACNSKKARETRLKHNGGIFWTDKQKQQIVNTQIRLYGSVANLEKGYRTKLKRYGNPKYVNGDKISETWGTKSKEDIKEIKDKQIQTFRDRYGDNWADVIREKGKKTSIEKYGVDNVFKLPEVQEKIKQTNLEKYGTMYPVTLFSYLNNKTISKINKRFYDKLLELGCNAELEKSIGNKAYDICVDKTLIEINPTYTHNSTVGPFIWGSKREPKSTTYHLEKTQTALANGYSCIHVWDWDDYDKIINHFKPKKTLYARNLEVRIVPNDVSRKFLNDYHFQGSCNNQQIKLGLYKDDDLIQMMTFGKPRYNKHFEYELLRLCTNEDYIVVGGANKLFKYFIDNYNPASIISYCDLSKFNGSVYTNLGFDLQSTSAPTRHWFNINTGRHITENLLNQRGFSQLHGDNDYKLYKKGDSNEQLMLENGYYEVYDCGQASYVWKKK